MGHYAGESGLLDRDLYNYQLVGALGFRSAFSLPGADIKRCPRCFSLVEGLYAEAHWWTLHQEIAYFTWSERLGEPWRLGLVSEEGAAFYADRNQDELVFEQAVDR